MAAPKLPFLWPMLFRPSSVPRTHAAISRTSTATSSNFLRRTCRQFSTTCHRADQPDLQRYGKAQEPAPHLLGQRAKDSTEKGEQEKQRKLVKEASKNISQESAEEIEDEDHVPVPKSSPSTPSQPSVDLSAPISVEPIPEPPPSEEPKVLDSVLEMPGPQYEAHKPPHLKTPPYVHHFDTYGLVRELNRNSAYSQAQSITIMKGVRQMLLDNMELARDGLVSKSDVENETYLFRAACSELKTEIGNTRRNETERMRTERTQLQHEVDILGQRLDQETMTLREELKGLFDDRKMSVREEQRLMQTKIQELGYKITVALNSDARSEVESLRWILTRRAAITLGISAFLIFVGLRYMSFVQHQEGSEKKKGPPHRPSPMEELVDAPVLLGDTDGLVGEVLATQGVSVG